MTRAEQFELVSGDLGASGHGAVHRRRRRTRPFAYLQCYNLSAWNVGFGPQPAGTRGLDQFIGEPDMLGRGHGSAFIRAFAERLLANGTPRVVTRSRSRQRAQRSGLMKRPALNGDTRRRDAGRPRRS